MKKVYIVLETLSETLKMKAVKSKTKAGAKAYLDATDLLLQEIINIEERIELEEKEKLAKQMSKFDLHHSTYSVLKERGHVGIPTQIHKSLSEYSMGYSDVETVLCELDKNFKKTLIDRVVSDKDMIEQLTAHRHNFHFITHSQGHDGINIQNEPFEVKNKKYKYNKDRKFDPSIVFDRLTPSTLRKLDEGRPNIILNITDEGKIMVEMIIEFTDELLNFYKNKVELLKNSKTSGCTIPFSLYRESIIDVSFVCDDIKSYNIQEQFLEYLTNLK